MMLINSSVIMWNMEDNIFKVFKKRKQNPTSLLALDYTERLVGGDGPRDTGL